MALNLLKRGESATPLNATQHDANFSAIETEVNAKLDTTDIAAAITPAAGALDLSGTTDGHVLTVQADGSLEFEAPSAATVNVDQYDVVARIASGTGSATGLTVGDLTEEGTPAAGDFLLGWESGGALRKFDVGDLPGGGGGGASQLSDLTDVGVTTPTNRNVLVADGDSWESRALVEADISDLGMYAAASHTHAAGDVVSGTFADARIAESNVTQHQAAIDHDALTNFVANEHIDWTLDQGATNIHAGNIPDLSATYQPLDSDLSTIAALPDPDADRILFWDDSAGVYAHLSVGTGLSLTGTELTATGGGGGTVGISGTPSANQVAVWAGTDSILGDTDFTFDGLHLTLGGSLFLGEQAAAATDKANFGQLWVDTSNDLRYTTEGGTDRAVAYAGGAFHDGFSDFVANEHVDHSTVTITAGTGLTGGGDITASRTLNVDVGITNDQVLTAKNTPVSGEFARFTTTGIEGLTTNELQIAADLEPGVDVQAYSTPLASIAGLTTAADRMIYTTAADVYAVASLTPFARTILDDANAGTVRATIDAQQANANLTAIAGLAVTDSNFIVGNGTTWVAETGATARTSLGLGSLATASNINNTNWSGTDLSVANGGTGVSTLASGQLVTGNGASAVTTTAIPAGGLVGVSATQTLTSKTIAFGSNTLTGTAHRTLYTDGTGALTQLAHGTSGQVLTSNGTTSAPSWQAAAGGGNVSKVGTPVDNQIGVWTGDGTIEGDADLTFDGSKLTLGTQGHLFMAEVAAALPDVAGQGQFWIDSDTGSGKSPMYTGADGVDYRMCRVVDGNQNDTWVAYFTNDSIVDGVPQFTFNDANGILTIRSDDGGSDVGPEYRSYRNSATPAVDDFLGLHDFQGNNSAAEATTYAQVTAQIEDPTDATEDGALVLRAMRNGTVSSKMVVGANVTLVGGATLDLDGNQIDSHRSVVLSSVSGSLTSNTHSGNVLVTSGNVTIPNAAGDVGFNCLLVAGGAHTVTFNSTTSPAMAAGDLMSIVVESTTVIHAVKTLAADKETFT